MAWVWTIHVNSHRASLSLSWVTMSWRSEETVGNSPEDCQHSRGQCYCADHSWGNLEPPSWNHKLAFLPISYYFPHSQWHLIYLSAHHCCPHVRRKGRKVLAHQVLWKNTSPIRRQEIKHKFLGCMFSSLSSFHIDQAPLPNAQCQASQCIHKEKEFGLRKKEGGHYTKQAWQCYQNLVGHGAF